MKNHPLQSVCIRRLFEAAAGKWTSCNWQTNFGSCHLNLEGLSARHTQLLADATAGEESKLWQSATEYLTLIERDAEAAQHAASKAAELFETESDHEAVSEINRAASLEAMYREPVTWKPLYEAIHAAVSQDA